MLAYPMASVLMTFRNAGFYGYGILLCAVIAAVVGLVAIVGTLASRRSRAWCWVGAAGLLLSGVGLSLGGLGTWLSRRRVDEVLADASVEWTSMEKLFVEGYGEARDVSVVALSLLAVPLLFNLVGAGLAAARARTSSGARPVLDAAVVGLAAGFALLGAVSSLVALPSSDEAARSHTLGLMKSELSSLLKRRDCDVCERLEAALQWRGADQLERDVPGACERARTCVEERLAVILGGKNRLLPRCRTDSLTLEQEAPEAFDESTPERRPQPEARPSASADADKGLSPEDEEKARMLREAAEVGMIGLLGHRSSGERRKAELEKLRTSPLLFDDAQKKEVAELIAKQDATDVRPEGGTNAVPALGASDSVDEEGAKKGNVREGAAVVTGGIPPEVIRRIVRQNQGRLRVCYQNGLERNPTLEGRVVVRFVIGRDGSVANVLRDRRSDFPDPQVITCVEDAFMKMVFPRSDNGIVTVTYPLIFSPKK